MRDTAIFLFDYTCIMAQPWLDTGYKCYCVDIQHSPGIHQEGNLFKVGIDLTKAWKSPVSKDRIAIVIAFPPCDHLSVSGARWLKGKGLRKLATSIDMFATATEFCEWSEAPYMIENPVSTISTYWRKPDKVIHPYYYTKLCSEDNYYKRTCLWIGNGFKVPKPCRDIGLGIPDERIHQSLPRSHRSLFRAATPLGFAKAVYLSNKGDEHECKREQTSISNSM